MFTTIDKALVPFAVMIVGAILGFFGITDDMSVGNAVPLIVSAFAVYFIPNKKVS